MTCEVSRSNDPSTHTTCASPWGPRGHNAPESRGERREKIQRVCSREAHLIVHTGSSGPRCDRTQLSRGNRHGKRPAPRPPKLLELPARAGGARKLRTSSAGGAPPPPSSLRRRGRRTARAHGSDSTTGQRVGAAKRGARDGSGAPRGAHRGGMIPVMMAAPSRGCSADSGDSSVKKASARARRRAPPQRRRCRRSANACRATKPGSEQGSRVPWTDGHGPVANDQVILEQKKRGFASGRRLARAAVSERATKITNPL